MTIELNFAKDAVGQCAYAPDFPSHAYSVALTTVSTASLTIPSDVQNWVVAIAYTASTEVWVSKNSSVSPPSQPSFQSTSSLLNPAQLKAYAGDVLNFYNNTASTTSIGVSLYARP